MNQRNGNHTRAGFTLTELLVVVFIIAVIGGLAAYFWPGFNQSQRSSQAASELHSWLLIARQSAMRDQAPRGLRLFASDPTRPWFFDRAQYLEQPDDFNGGTVQSSGLASGNPSLTVVSFGNVDLTGGFFADTTQKTWPVQNGDAIQFHGSGLMHQILNIDPATMSITLASPLPYPILTPQKNYKIVRKPRLQGDEPMDMPSDVAIDATLSNSFAGFTNYTAPAFPALTPLPINADGTIDIMFAPSGSLLANGAATDKLIFWVRDTTSNQLFANGKFQGDPSLVAIYGSSGFVSAYDVDLMNQANPFSKVK
jgi:prepilin-type N-terminal cleavage/methylation domain-containing protein